MFKLLLGWSLKISYNPSHTILTWLLHYISAPRQSAQSGQLSFQLLLLKSCINIPDQLILSMGFKPHWHADESKIKWQAWEPSDVNEFTHTEMMGTPGCKPRGACSKNSFSALLMASLDECLLQRILNYTQFSKHPFLNTMKHTTSRKGKNMLICTLTKWNVQFSGTGRLMWIKEVQTQMSTGVGQVMQMSQLENLNSKLCKGRVWLH